MYTLIYGSYSILLEEYPLPPRAFSNPSNRQAQADYQSKQLESSGDRSARAPRKTAVRDGRAGGAAVRGSAGGCRAAAGALPPRGLPPGPYRLLRLPPSPPALTVPVSPSLPTLASARMLMSCALHLASAGCGS